MTISHPCDHVRERLPELLRDELGATERRELERHVDGCADCQAERRVLRAVLDALPEIPGTLEARVLAAQRRPPVRPARLSPARLGMAATVAAAVIGGALMIDAGLGRPSGNGTVPAGETALLPAYVEPLVPRSVLPELTEAELEQLLKEMES
ncbi:MAG TPA: anti-sigma factor [Longimicrobiales bacterium]|nr:anti-sigma factor [Longimicrobiales bacterium]